MRTSPPIDTDPIDLTGRTAIVAGAATGVGRGITRRLHDAGAAIVIADPDGAEAGLVADELNAERPHSALAIQVDLSRPGDAETMVTAAARQFGGLDILVTIAADSPFCGFLEMSAEVFARVVAVNLTGTFLAMQAAARHMVAQGRGGRIINVTSVDALHPSIVGQAHEDASERGVWGLTQNVALELAPHGIAVTAVAPGGADLYETGRVVLFLASDLSSYLAGSPIVADGGLLLH